MKRLWEKFLWAVFCFSCCVSADAQQQPEYRETLSELSAEINAQMDELKQSSRALTDSLQIADSRLQMLSSERDGLKAALSGYSSSMRSTNELLASYSASLTEYEARLSEAVMRNNRRTAVCIVIAALFASTRIAGAVLWAKGVKLPYLLNLIL